MSDKDENKHLIKIFCNGIVYAITIPIYFWISVCYMSSSVCKDIITKIWLYLETGSTNPRIVINNVYDEDSSKNEKSLEKQLKTN